MNSPFHAPYIQRRSFLKTFVPALLGGSIVSKTIRELSFINRAVAQSGGISDYKALVCVFLNGGNDSNNLIIPTLPNEYASYATVRTPAVALPNVDGTGATAQQLFKSDGVTPYTDTYGHQFGFNPAMPELANLFKTGQCAPLLNVGTLSYPITKAQYTGKSVPFPPQLFSHSDQQNQWQTSTPDQPYSSGWGGRMADLFTSPTDVNSGGAVSMAVTLAGSNLFEVGNVNAAPQYAITTGGAVTLSGVTGARLTAFQGIINSDMALPDLQTKAYSGVLNHAITEANTLSTALLTNQSASWLTNRFNSNNTIVTPNGGSTFSSSLMNQMKMVARLIDLGSQPTPANGGVGLGMKRQIFFVQVGGYDTHTGQTNNAGQSTPNNSSVVIGAQANLLAELSQTLNAFMGALTDIGTAHGDANFSKRVAAFTVSDFNRTFPSNGSGSDHGWGGNQLIVGGAVNGGKTYGKLPTLAVNGPDDTGIGRWIPTTSVDQYGATLASWYGVQPQYLTTVFPNVDRFATQNLGFI